MSSKSKPAEIDFYKDPKGDWRWRSVAPENAKKLAGASEGYKNHSEMVQAMRRTAKGINRFLREYDKVEPKHQASFVDECAASIPK